MCRISNWIMLLKRGKQRKPTFIYVFLIKMENKYILCKLLISYPNFLLALMWCTLQKKFGGQDLTYFWMFFLFLFRPLIFEVFCLLFSFGSLWLIPDWPFKSLHLEMPQTWFSWPSLASSGKFLLAYTQKWFPPTLSHHGNYVSVCSVNVEMISSETVSTRNGSTTHQPCMHSFSAMTQSKRKLFPRWLVARRNYFCVDSVKDKCYSLKTRVPGLWEHKDLVNKKKRKISCLCTF